jgi:hypothetical protein
MGIRFPNSNALNSTLSVQGNATISQGESAVLVGQQSGILYSKFTIMPNAFDLRKDPSISTYARVSNTSWCQSQNV